MDIDAKGARMALVEQARRFEQHQYALIGAKISEIGEVVARSPDFKRPMRGMISGSRPRISQNLDPVRRQAPGNKPAAQKIAGR